jgi:hypothetical protein
MTAPDRRHHNRVETLAKIERAADRARAARDAWLRQMAQDACDTRERRALRDRIVAAERGLLACVKRCAQ